MAQIQQMIEQASHYFAQRKFLQAQQLAEQILEKQPRFADAHHLIGVIKLSMDNNEDAIAHIQRAIAINSSNSDFHANLGTCFSNLGRTDEALKCFNSALKIKPRNISSLNGKAIILSQQGKYDESIVIFKKCIKLSPKDVNYKINLAKTYVKVEQIDNAKSIAERAVLMDKNNPVAKNQLGLIYQITGEMNKAEEQYRKAIKLKPDFANAFYNLSKIYKFSIEDQETIDQFENLLELKTMAKSERSNIHFALGKIYDDIGEWGKAFSHYQKANALMSINFNRASFSHYIDQIIETYDQLFFEEVNKQTENTESPVFIVGMPRSGTTLAEQIISVDLNIKTLGEKQFIPDFTRNMSKFLNTTEPYPLCMKSITSDNLSVLAKDYLDMSGAEINARTVEKMPMNFLHLGLIYKMFPGVKIIHCKRNALDTILSCYFQNFSNKIDFTYDLDNLLFYYKQYQRLMAHWKKVLPVTIFELDYQMLIEDRETVIKQLIDYCDLPWHDLFLEFNKVKREVYTASNWQVRQSLYSKSVNRWKNYQPYIENLIAALEEKESIKSGVLPKHDMEKPGFLQRIISAIKG